MKSKALVIFGAGASFDCWNQSSLVQDYKWTPPLTRQLFDLNARGHFKAILNHYPAARCLAADLAPKATHNMLDLERELRVYATHSDERLRRGFKDILLYIRNVLHQSSNAWLSPSNASTCYTQLITALHAQSEHEILFLTLNYDTLLEQALALFGLNIERHNSLIPSDFGQYITMNNGLGLIKLHGSIDWFNSIGSDDDYTTWEDAINSYDPLTRNTPVYIVDVSGDPAAVRPSSLFYRSGHWIYPAMTAPIADKDDDCYVCPSDQIELLKVFTTDCKKVLIIGASGLDNDLMKVLASSNLVPEIVHYVGGSECEEVKKRFEKGAPQFGSAGTIDITAGQFINYLLSNTFTRFRKWPN